MLPGIVPLYHTTSYVSIYFGIACVCVCVCALLPFFFLQTHKPTGHSLSLEGSIFFFVFLLIQGPSSTTPTTIFSAGGDGWMHLRGGEKAKESPHSEPCCVFFFFKSVGGKRMEAKKFRQWVLSFLFGFVSLSCCYLPSLPFGKVGRTSVCVSVNAIDSCIF